MRVALATAAEARGLDEDEPALVAALAARGVEAVAVAWDDPGADWASFGLVVVRSTWDYAARRAEFVAWAERVASATRLRNPVAVLRWNTAKGYLHRLADLGVPVVPTTWAPVGAVPPVPGGEVVVKPVVSAGGRDTTRYPAGQGARALEHVARLHAEGRDAMVQPYLPAIEAGEIAIVHLGGTYSHAVRKVVRLPAAGGAQALFAPEEMAPHAPTAAQREVADRALAGLLGDPSSLLYARVDLVGTADGSGMVMEVELTEPSLFLTHAPGAVERFADAVAAAVPAARR